MRSSIQVFRRPSLLLAFGLVATVAAYPYGGWKGAAGMALGLVGTTLHLIGMWLAVRSLGATVENEPGTRFSLIVSLLFAALLFPAVVIGFLIARQLGSPAFACFLLGLGLVYCGLIGWALTTS